LRAQSSKLRQGIARLIDSYAEGVLAKEEFEPRLARMKQRVTSLEDRLQQLADDATQQRDLRLIISQLEDFVAKGRGGLATADWRTRREIIRALVRRVAIDKQQVSVVFRVPPTSTNSGPDSGILPDCRRSGGRPLRDPSLGGLEGLPDQHAHTQIFAHQLQQALVADLAGDPGHQGVMVDPVEKLR